MSSISAGRFAQRCWFLKETQSNCMTAPARFISGLAGARVISPLAEGSDRFVAEVGLALGL